MAAAYQRLEARRTAVEVVEAARHLAREFHVRGLVLAHRHVGGLVDEDVSRLQQRIAEEAIGGEVAVLELLDLVLVGRHPLQPAQRRAHGQQGEQLGVLGQPALDEDRRLVRVEAGGDPVDHHVVDVLLDHLAVFVVRGQRMPVGHEVEAVVLVLQAHPVLQRTVVVAEVQRAGGAHAGQHAGTGGAGGGGRGVWHGWRHGCGSEPRIVSDVHCAPSCHGRP